MSTHTTGGSTHEPGYKAVLVREETKQALRVLRASLQDRDLFQERRLATAGLELALELAAESQDGLQRLLEKTRDVVVRDLSMPAATR